MARRLALAGPPGRVPVGPVPVEYAVAVAAYLEQAALSPASRRVYRISLAGWAWPLVGRPVPSGDERRGATPPVVPLALLDDVRTAGRLAGAVAERAGAADARTVNRELSALRSAVAWWRDRGWIQCDPVAGLSHLRAGAVAAPLSEEQIAAVFQVAASLREHALWRLLHDSAASATDVLALDADALDLARHRVRGPDGRPGGGIAWQDGTNQLLRWLLTGRTWGPVFVTDRRAPAGTPAGDICPVTGRARMSYRRAAEIFTAATRPLDPAGKGWTLHQLRGEDRWTGACG